MNGYSSQDLGLMGQRIIDQGQDPKDPAVVEAAVQKQSDLNRQEELDELDARLGEANIADEKIKADIKQRGINALIEGGKAGLKFGALVQDAAVKNKGKQEAVQSAHVGERASNLAERGKLTESRANKLVAKQNKLLGTAGLDLDQDPYTPGGDLYTQQQLKSAQNSRESSLLGGDKPEAAKFTADIMGNRGNPENLVEYMKDYSKMTADHQKDLAYLRSVDPAAYLDYMKSQESK
jgi:hypothetical protein|tara:strand:- start:2182 stop:2889 length:708 start_codon:yes stop_codon:yes gene_type:complete